VTLQHWPRELGTQITAQVFELDKMIQPRVSRFQREHWTCLSHSGATDAPIRRMSVDDMPIFLTLTQLKSLKIAGTSL
jgi:hypothetical protein